MKPRWLFMNKKAEGLSMSVIVIAAISLLVLVILIVLVVGQLRKVPPAVGCQGAVNGVCADSCDALEGTYTVDVGNSGKAGGCQEGEVCCLKVA